MTTYPADKPDSKRAKSGVQCPTQTYEAFRSDVKAAPLHRRVRMERDGVSHAIVERLTDELNLSTSDVLRILNIPKATYTKKLREKEFFNGISGQSVVGLLDLINKVEDMLQVELSAAEIKKFDIEGWVGRWIKRAQPALGGLAPAELMDTPSGRESVMRLLGALQSGAYQ
jgi:uncharacterized protein (DUF2384 family)